MQVAVDAVELSDEQRDELWSYLVMAAHSMVNTLDTPGPPGGGVGTLSPES
jgi:truncated hemoglobin YjbI